MNDNNVEVYNAEVVESNSKIRFFFESLGETPDRNIIKVIDYTPISQLDGRTVYNLGFGDYDPELDEGIDSVNSNNGDVYKVFNTVLNSVDEFFDRKKDGAVFVRGSDSQEGFVASCRLTCSKNCSGECKNSNRRIRIYRNYVDRNLKDLVQDYVFFGSNRTNHFSFEQYVPGSEYFAILVFKKK